MVTGLSRVLLSWLDSVALVILPADASSPVTRGYPRSWMSLDGSDIYSNQLADSASSSNRRHRCSATAGR